MADNNPNTGGMDFDPFENMSSSSRSVGEPNKDANGLYYDHEAALDYMIQTPVSQLIPANNEPELVGPEGTSYANLSDIEKYTHQDTFDGMGFNPTDPQNYERWVAKETWGSALAKGFDSFGDKFSNTFSDYWKDYGRMASSLAHMDASRLTPDEQEMLGINMAEHKSAMENYVFVPEDEQDDIFGKKSMSEFIGNAGFAMGTISALSLELIADSLITLGTGGAGAVSFGATFARLGGKMGLKTAAKTVGKKVVKEGLEEGAELAMKKGNFFTGMTKTANESLDTIKASASQQARGVADIANNPSAMRQSMNAFSEVFSFNTKAIAGSKTFGELTGNIIKGTPILGTGAKYAEKIAAASKSGKGFGELAGMGFSGIRRMGQEYNLAATEASFEAITSYGDTLDKMISQHEAETGKSVTAEELAVMKEYAGQASFANYSTNLAILLATNQLQFGSLFNRFTPANRVVSELINDSSQGSILKVRRMFGMSKVAGKTYKKGFWGTYGLTGQIAKDFGKKQATYEVSKQFLRGFTKWELSEGLQENFQEMSGSAWKNYYAGKVNGVNYTLSDAFGEGAAEQFTKQGFKTFLQGALTGSLIRIPTAGITKVSQGLQEYSVNRQYEDGQSPIQKAEARLEADVNSLNNFLVSLGDKKVDNTVVNFDAQLNSSQAQTEAAGQGKEYEFMNAKDNAMLSAALTANRIGAIDVLVNGVREMGEEMSAEEFESTFNVKLSETNYNSPKEFASKVSKDLKKYSDSVDKIRQNVKSKLEDPYVHEEGSDDMYLASMMRNVQEDAIHLIALNSLKAQRASERAEKVVADYNSISELATSSDYVYRVLSKPEMISSEFGNISADIKILKENLKTEGLTPKDRKDAKKQLKNKEREFKLLEEWESFFSSREEVVNYTDDVGAEQSYKENVLDVFVGKKSAKKVQELDEEGNVIDEQHTYDTHDKNVRRVFREILNLKNKQLGNETTVYAKNVEAGFDKIMDFIKLDKDARDYTEAVESLYSPETYRATIKHMRDGKFKNKLLAYASNIENQIVEGINKILLDRGIIVIDVDEQNNPYVKLDGIKTDEYYELQEKMVNAIIKSEPYKNIMNIIIDPNLGVAQNKYVQEQLKKIDSIIKSEFQSNMSEYAPGYVFEEVISDEDMKLFNEKKEASEEIKDAIAKSLFENDNDINKLSSRQQEIYNQFSGSISAKRASLKSEVEDEVTEVDPRVATVESLKKDLEGEFPPTGEAKTIIEESIVSLEAELEAEKIKTVKTPDTIEGPELDTQMGEKPVDEYTGAEDVEAEAGRGFSRTSSQQQLDTIFSKLAPLAELKMKGVLTTDEGLNVNDEIEKLTAESKALRKSMQEVENVTEAEPKQDGEVTGEEFTELTEEPVGEDESSHTVSENKEQKFDVKDRDGNILSSHNTEEKAREVQKQIDINHDNLDFVQSLLNEIKTTDAVVSSEVVVAVIERLNPLLEAYNAKPKTTNHETLKSFYEKSTKGNKKAVNKVINDYIKLKPEFVKAKPDTLIEDSGVTAEKKGKQDSQTAKEETEKQIFTNAVNALHNELKGVSMPTTQSGKTIAIIFPEDTVNFDKFVISTKEDQILNSLKNIKFSCKK